MLEVRNLEVVYHHVVLVLKGISLTVPDGGIACVLGPNGAGKTTLLRALTGLLSIHDGEVTKGSSMLGTARLDGQPADAIVRLGISQVMEGRRILGELSVEDNLRAGAIGVPRATLDERLERAFQRFPVLGERRRQPAGYLSGGEQQMLAISRALMSGPRLLLLDEPSLGLAPLAIADVAALIREINAGGVAILLVEQNAAMALELAQHGYVLDNGKVVLDGPSHALKDDPDVQEFYLGTGAAAESKSYRDVKLYRRRKRWLS
ncbi:MAG TPA: ABC transporter ATP-binding protein [Kofleriaceae bacterium]|jgi:branched-chain amino acid transport system ATP-binding protein|nr:ABC transporter ATP-binding protein [Kofleriaceae bacterium]